MARSSTQDRQRVDGHLKSSAATGPVFTICIPCTIYQFDISMQHIARSSTDTGASVPGGVPTARAALHRDGEPFDRPVQAVPWPGELATRRDRGRADLPDRGTRLSLIHISEPTRPY